MFIGKGVERSARVGIVRPDSKRRLEFFAPFFYLTFEHINQSKIAVEIFGGGAQTAQLECFAEILDGLRPVLGFRSFQTVAAQFLDSVIDLTLLLQGLETLQEYLRFRTSHPAQRLSKGVEGIFIARTGPHRDLHTAQAVVTSPELAQSPALSGQTHRVLCERCRREFNHI